MNKKTTVSPEMFVTTWQTAKNLEELAQKLGISKVAAKVRAYTFRKNGVPLKHFDPRGGTAYNWQKLAALAKDASDEAPPNRKNGIFTPCSEVPNEEAY